MAAPWPLLWVSMEPWQLCNPSCSIACVHNYLGNSSEWPSACSLPHGGFLWKIVRVAQTPTVRLPFIVHHSHRLMRRRSRTFYHSAGIIFRHYFDPWATNFDFLGSDGPVLGVVCPRQPYLTDAVRNFSLSRIPVQLCACSTFVMRYY